MYPPLQAPKRLLFGPGPSMVAPRVYQAMAQPVVGHLDPFFFQVADEIRALLGYAYSTKNQFNLAISGTGSSGMEAAVANFAEPGEKFALLTNGFFGDRIGEMARRQGAEVVRLAKDWGEPFDPQEAREFIRRERPHVVAFVQAETSTGMFNQAQADLRSGARSGRADHRRLRDVARRHAGAGGRERHRHRLQLHAEGPRLPAGPGADDGFAARARPAEGAHDAGALLVSRPAAAGHLLHRPQVSPHGVGDLFYALREGLAMVAKRAWRIAGSGTGAITRRSSRASRRWASRCTWPIRPPAVDPEYAARAGRRRRRQGPPYLLEKRGIEIAGGFGPLAARSSASA